MVCSQVFKEFLHAPRTHAGALAFALGLVIQTGTPHAQQPTRRSAGTPTIDELISLKRAGSAAISPNGQWVAYTVRDTNWDENAYHTEIWLADAKSGELRQLTSHAKKSSTSPTWSPDSSKLAFATDRDDKRQIYLIDPRGGEARKLTSAEEGVGGFAWAPDGKSLAFTSDRPEDRRRQGSREEVRRLRRLRRGLPDVAPLGASTSRRDKARRLTSGAFTVGQFSWSPDGTQIAFDHRINSAEHQRRDRRHLRRLRGRRQGPAARHAAGRRRRPGLVARRIEDRVRVRDDASSSPSSTRAIARRPGRRRPRREHHRRLRRESLDRPLDAPAGLFFSASHRTWAFLYSIDPATKAVKKYTPSEQWIGIGVQPDAGRAVGGVHRRRRVDAWARSTCRAAVAADARSRSARKLTDMTAQTAAWAKSALEVVSWKSQDGATIEGVLHKPIGFQPGKKYPLLVVIHGGPTGISRPTAYSSTSIYPIDIWTAKGALVLEPNYRGSAGYGEAFRSLNVRNLGVGDAWDVLSGIDHLIKEGLADPNQVGTMGWSQGGYISAFLTTHDSARFKAVSVGAGISDWMTYYVNTDITQFTRHYLKATPWDDPEIYAKTSPITYVKNAKAPTLIQHGATDQRVPPPNAFQLYRGLQDVGVPSKLIIYKGFEGIGHGPSKPKSSRAVMQHNLEWFDKYILGVDRDADVAGPAPLATDCADGRPRIARNTRTKPIWFPRYPCMPWLTTAFRDLRAVR